MRDHRPQPSWKKQVRDAEAKEQLSALSVMNCEFGQSFIFSEAVEELEVRSILKKLVEDTKQKE